MVDKFFAQIHGCETINSVSLKNETTKISEQIFECVSKMLEKLNLNDEFGNYYFKV